MWVSREKPQRFQIWHKQAGSILGFVSLPTLLVKILDNERVRSTKCGGIDDSSPWSIKRLAKYFRTFLTTSHENELLQSECRQRAENFKSNLSEESVHI
jgi:hypothetical protein